MVSGKVPVSDVGASMNRLLEVMRKLRLPSGCSWDRAQALESLRPFLLEEAYEVLDAMTAAATYDSWSPLQDELGDLLFQIVFQAQIAAERGRFTFQEVVDGSVDKVLRRHPHIFDESGETPRASWAEVKAAERRLLQGGKSSALDGGSRHAPALLHGQRLGEKAASVGFDWPNSDGARAKIHEELAELDLAVASGDLRAIEDELGDLFFSLTNYARHLGVSAEVAARAANRKFERRFRSVERSLSELGESPASVGLDTLNFHWNKAKAGERAKNPKVSADP